jgi:hypothetical protein
MRDVKDWTYGAEHEFGDWDRRRGIPAGFKLDERDVTMINSNGIAVDPKGKVYPFGGEFNTPPTETPMDQVACLGDIKRMHPEVFLSYRSNLHVHVRVPGLSEDLDRLKQLARFNLKWLPEVLPLIEPIPEPTRAMYPERDEFEGAWKRYLRRRKSHQTKLTLQRVRRQFKATTVQEFHDLGVPWSKDGKPLPYCQPRCAVNVRQLLETDTIEFRHFPGTLDSDRLLTAVEWCREYLRCAFTDENPVSMFKTFFADRPWPQFCPYVHWMEQRYLQTTHNGTRTKGQIRTAIILIESEDADDPRFGHLSR